MTITDEDRARADAKAKETAKILDQNTVKQEYKKSPDKYQTILKKKTDNEIKRFIINKIERDEFVWEWIYDLIKTHEHFDSVKFCLQCNLYDEMIRFIESKARIMK